MAGLVLGGIGSIVGGVGAASAGKAQASAAKQAAQLQNQLGEQQLATNQSQFATTQANEAPWLAAGKNALGTLSGLTSTPGQGLLQNFGGSFSAPTAAEAAATPGEQFELAQGLGATQGSAAAGGNLLSTGTQKGLINYANNVASTNYQQAYNNALTNYQTQFNQFQIGQNNQYNRLAGISGTGQTTAGQLGQQGNQFAANAGQIAGNTGQQVGNSLNLAGAATASGYAGAANAVSSGFGNAQQSLLLNQILAQQNNPAGGGGTNDPQDTGAFS